MKTQTKPLIGYTHEQLLEIQSNFHQELKEANNGRKTSLPYIVQQMPNASIVKGEEPFQVLVIGGSVFKKAILRREGGKLILLKREEKQQPFFHSRDDFFSFIEKELDPDVHAIAVNFAYPLQPVFERGKADGVLLRSVKEHKFEGLIGKMLGREIETYFKEKHGRTLSVSVANDSVCLLLSGLTQFTSQDIAGGIVGTGMNFALFLDNNKCVNLEAANFDKFLQSDEGKDIDIHSSQRGKALFEKETSGAYLFKQFNYLTQKYGIGNPPLASTAELDELTQSFNPEVASIAKGLLQKSAALVACVVGGITLFKKKDMVFVMEGSLFWNATDYKEHVKNLMIKLVPHYNVTFAKIEDSPIFGGAKLIS